MSLRGSSVKRCVGTGPGMRLSGCRQTGRLSTPAPVDRTPVDDPTLTQIGYRLMALEVNDIVAAKVGSARTI
ncbi:hypothetical protein [Immundisolibacter cernigliae]|uniref:Uncharacterized protein n=1 Tax=Immundisolibacter cernigliae TaxID=1810504 RepID=A0A1B1YQ90_9GAMM|nr:hypothetical protein [Immundisolibacter cernigliae]ANX02925.1 hypothetical protein PG2T_01100 [Immundisolibacter cernigliae]